MFHRKIENKLHEYYKNPDAEIVIVTGARQIGKSFIIRETAKTSFPHFIEINMQDDLDGDRLFANVKTTKEFYWQVSVLTQGVLAMQTTPWFLSMRSKCIPNCFPCLNL